MPRLRNIGVKINGSKKGVDDSFSSLPRKKIVCKTSLL